MLNGEYAESSVIILHNLFALESVPAAEWGPAAFVDTGRRGWSEIVDMCNIASRRDSCLKKEKIWGARDGCRTAVVSAANKPKEEWLSYQTRNDPLFVIPKWYQTDRAKAVKIIDHAASLADIVFIWKPSKLLAGGTVWDNAQLLLEAIHGGGAIYGFEDADVRFSRMKHKTAYA